MNALSQEWQLTGYEFTLELLAALARLSESQREAWIDRYVAGLPYPSNSRKTMAYNAARRLRELLAEQVAA